MWAVSYTQYESSLLSPNILSINTFQTYLSHRQFSLWPLLSIICLCSSQMTDERHDTKGRWVSKNVFLQQILDVRHGFCSLPLNVVKLWFCLYACKLILFTFLICSVRLMSVVIVAMFCRLMLQFVFVVLDAIKLYNR